MKNLPIKNQMNTVFVHVTDLKAAAKWYGDLLGIEVDLNKVTSPVFNVPVTGTTSLTLDDHAFDQPSVIVVVRTLSLIYTHLILRKHMNT